MEAHSGLAGDWQLGGGQGAIRRDYRHAMGHLVAAAQPLFCSTGNGDEGPDRRGSFSEAGGNDRNGEERVSPWRLLWRVMTNRDDQNRKLEEHQRWLEALDTRVSLLEAIEAMKHLTRNGR